ERREGAEYARDLLIAAAARDGADQTPHQVWGTARADWALTRLAASGEFINDSPFTGTRMGDIMAEREAQRAERFSEFFTLTQIPPRKKQTLTPQPEPESPGKSAVPVGSSPRDPVREAEKAVTVLEEQRRVVAQQYRQIGEHLNQVQGQEHQIGQQIEQVTRQITQAQQARDGRGWLAKMLKPNEGAEQMEQWSKQQAGLERERTQVAQQREGLERDLAQ